MMTDAFIEAFLDTFDDSRFPEDFLRRYELMECYSHNDQGETLLVKDRQTGRQYVAKCYPEQSLLSPAKESGLLKQLHLDGLPAYIGEYQNEGMRCVVREYAPGKPLNQVVRERPLAWQQSIDIVVQLCDILTYLHSQTPQIIHRDIKPQNIIVDDQGNITLIDFGISRIYDEKAQEDTLCFGTRRYAAPEQYGFAQTDCRSDIYSLGVLLCWLLTGNDDVQYAVKSIPNRWLANIVTKCTEFSPKDRYQNAVQVRDALNRKTIRNRTFSILFVSMVILAAVLFFALSPKNPIQASNAITFKEPLIEQAVRLTLNKNAADEITEQELLSITEINIFGDKAAADANSFRTYADQFVNVKGAVQRGSISVLDDLRKLKNLRSVSLCYQNIVDITPLADLVYLESVNLQHNPIQDISPLANLSSLSTLTIFDTRVSDLTALKSCTHLSVVDAGYSQIRSMAALEGLSALRTLVMRKAPLQSLDGIEKFPLLEKIYLSETQVLDLTPLLGLTRLQLVEVDQTMQESAKAVSDNAQFEIIIQ